MLIRKFNIQWSTSLNVCSKVLQTLSWDPAIASNRNAEKWLEMRTALLDIPGLQNRFFKSIQIRKRFLYCCHSTSFSYYTTESLFHTVKIKQNYIFLMDWICKIPHLFLQSNVPDQESQFMVCITLYDHLQNA